MELSDLCAVEERVCFSWLISPVSGSRISSRSKQMCLEPPFPIQRAASDFLFLIYRDTSLMRPAIEVKSDISDLSLSHAIRSSPSS